MDNVQMKNINNTYAASMIFQRLTADFSFVR